MSATAKKQKPLKRHPSKLKRMSAYMILAIILISIMAVLFAFPLYWIITGSFKTGAAINSTTPEWWPSEWVLTNYQKLFAGKALRCGSWPCRSAAISAPTASPSTSRSVPPSRRPSAGWSTPSSWRSSP